ncbi:MAG TPA: cation diffusion facilitator family transporter [Ignavibacteriaceae bacterium]|nr:cation diffusion facilitator family transporter [Ignavibacteriaceae bacterium]
MHYHNSKVSSNRNLAIAILLNSFISIAEFLAGILINSLALISDALHNISDVFALILSYIASRIMGWDSNHKKTFGYLRIEILVALVNSVSLVVVGGYIIYEAIDRISTPSPLPGLWIMIIAGIGFVVNFISSLLLKHDAHKDLNIKSAYLHLVTDALNSLAVIVAGGLIYFFEWFFLDPLISIAIGSFVIKSAWDIILETVNILTEGTPKGINVNDVVNEIKSINGVCSVHHLHIWSLSSRFRALSAHIVVDDGLISDKHSIVMEIGLRLEKGFGINHPTIQLETSICSDQKVIVNLNEDKRSI